ncbi:MAG: YqaJ viral recombinase family protein [Nitrososphaerota archaeon]
MKDRSTYIGASESAALFGVHPHLTAYELWAIKLGQISPPPPNEAMLWGQILQAVILAAWKNIHRRPLLRGHKFRRHPRYKFIGCNLDALSTDANGNPVILECKVSSRWWDSIPEHYWIQVQHQMYVTGIPRARLVVLFAGIQLEEFEVAYSTTMGQTIENACIDFWNNYILKKVPPPMKLKDFERYAIPEGSVFATEEIAQLITQRYPEVLQRYTEALEQYECIRNMIKEYMGNAEALLYGSHILATWKRSANGARRLVIRSPRVHSVLSESSSPNVSPSPFGDPTLPQ